MEVKVLTQALGWQPVHKTCELVPAQWEFVECGDLGLHNDDWKYGEMGRQVLWL